MRVKNGVEPINHTADTARGGSRPKPPKAVAQRASLEAPGAVSEHQTAKRRLTAKTVALDPGKRRQGNRFRGPGRQRQQSCLGLAGVTGVDGDLAGGVIDRRTPQIVERIALACG